jgi:anti-sigma regulatory factor (Ser/Thr protein kinase)
MTGYLSGLADPPRLADGPTSVSELHWLRSAVRMAASLSGNWPLPAQPGALDWSRLPRVATRTPGTEFRSVGAARDFAVTTLFRWGATQRADDMAVVVSELMTNALRHALPDSTAPKRFAIRLGLLDLGPCVLCAVADPSKRTPVPTADPGFAETGRGLRVVAALADLWGYTEPGDDGKVVWAVFWAPDLARRLRETVYLWRG